MSPVRARGVKALAYNNMLRTATRFPNPVSTKATFRSLAKLFKIDYELFEKNDETSDAFKELNEKYGLEKVQELREILDTKKKILIDGKKVFEMTFILLLCYDTRQEYIDLFLRDPLLNLALQHYSPSILESLNLPTK